MNNGKITAVIITKNEERNIERCLVSLKGIADEIIIIDSFSTDNTKTICNRFDVNFQELDWQGYSFAKNYGNSLANFPYILSLDADEALSEELRYSLLIEKEKLNGIYSFNRRLNYCGKWIYHSGVYPDKKTRLFPKGISSWNDSQVHETLTSSATKITHLKGDLLHYSYYSIEEHIERCNFYTDISSDKYISSSVLMLTIKMIVTPIFRFFVSYFLKLGFLDGFYGFFICCMQAFDKFLKYQKAILKKRKNTTSPNLINQYYTNNILLSVVSLVNKYIVEF